MSTNSVFDVPELVGLIASHITLQDRVRCMRTCKSFHAAFAPFLWTSLSILDYRRHQLDEDDTHAQLRRIWEMVEEGRETAKAILRNRHRLRSIDLDYFTQRFINFITKFEDDESALPCTNLRRLTVKADILEVKGDWVGQADGCPDANIRFLMRTNPHLTVLGLTGKMLWDDDICEDLVAIIETQLPALKTLHFSSYLEGSIPLDALIDTMEAITKRPRPSTLIEFNCNCEMEILVADRGPQRALNLALLASKLEGKFVGPESKTAIKKLKLPSSRRAIPIIILERILGYCVPDLESFDIPKVTAEEAPRLGQLLAQHCPKLVQLTGDHIFNQGNEEDEYSSAAHAIRACMGNQGGGLRSIIFHYFEDDDGLTEAILEHTDTLQEVIFVATEMMKSLTVQRILSRCTNLVTFVLPDCQNQPVALKFSDVLGGSSTLGDDLEEGREWVCKKLKTLRLTLDRDLDGVKDVYEDEVDLEALQESDTEDETEMAAGPQVNGADQERKIISHEMLDKVVARKVYAQIGKLSELEELAIWFGYEDPSTYYFPKADHAYRKKGPYLKDLTMGVGLPALSGLKKLRRLFLTKDIWTKMGQAEVEFMVREWPSLERILWDTDEGEGFLEEVALPHWQWLKEHRPEVRIAGDVPFEALGRLWMED